MQVHSVSELAPGNLIASSTGVLALVTWPFRKIWGYLRTPPSPTARLQLPWEDREAEHAVGLFYAGGRRSLYIQHKHQSPFPEHTEEPEAEGHGHGHGLGGHEPANSGGKHGSLVHSHATVRFGESELHRRWVSRETEAGAAAVHNHPMDGRVSAVEQKVDGMAHVIEQMSKCVSKTCCCLLLPAVACCCLLLPAVACCLLLPAVACCCLLLRAVACCCICCNLVCVSKTVDGAQHCPPWPIQFQSQRSYATGTGGGG